MPVFEKDKVFFVIKMDNTLILGHSGHTPNPHVCLHRMIPEGTINQIKMLHEAGITPNQIQNFLTVKGEDLISTIQIQSLLHPEKVIQFTVESEELIMYMKNHDGYTEELNFQSEEGITRLAVLTIQKIELKNMQEYGDVIFIDGTYASLNTKWEIFPITAITKSYNICCCGILYAASGNENFLTWMLHQLSKLEQFRSMITTIITDEDHSFINAFNNWLKDINQLGDHKIINHILCSFHKAKNLAKKLTKYGLNEEQKSIAKEYFQIICYHPHLKTVNDALSKCKNHIGSKLKHYFEKLIEPLLP